jgi:hypothetical protein
VEKAHHPRDELFLEPILVRDRNKIGDQPIMHQFEMHSSGLGLWVADPVFARGLRHRVDETHGDGIGEHVAQV